jgi:hypothetical protein
MENEITNKGILFRPIKAGHLAIYYLTLMAIVSIVAQTQYREHSAFEILFNTLALLYCPGIILVIILYVRTLQSWSRVGGMLFLAVASALWALVTLYGTMHRPFGFVVYAILALGLAAIVFISFLNYLNKEVVGRLRK